MSIDWKTLCVCGHKWRDHTVKDSVCTIEGCSCMMFIEDINPNRTRRVFLPIIKNTPERSSDEERDSRPLERLTDEERKAIEQKQQVAICKCGHLRSGHSKFINGVFVGCQFEGCNCKKFEWPEIKKSNPKHYRKNKRRK